MWHKNSKQHSSHDIGRIIFTKTKRIAESNRLRPVAAVVFFYRVFVYSLHNYTDHNLINITTLKPSKPMN